MAFDREIKYRRAFRRFRSRKAASSEFICSVPRHFSPYPHTSQLIFPSLSSASHPVLYSCLTSFETSCKEPDREHLCVHTHTRTRVPPLGGACISVDSDRGCYIRRLTTGHHLSYISDGRRPTVKKCCRIWNRRNNDVCTAT